MHNFSAKNPTCAKGRFSTTATIHFLTLLLGSPRTFLWRFGSTIHFGQCAFGWNRWPSNHFYSEPWYRGMDVIDFETKGYSYKCKTKLQRSPGYRRKWLVHSYTYCTYILIVLPSIFIWIMPFYRLRLNSDTNTLKTLKKCRSFFALSRVRKETAAFEQALYFITLTQSLTIIQIKIDRL